MEITIFFLVVGCLGAVLGDTPANCTYEDVRGTWYFYLGDTGYDRSVDCSKSFDVKMTISVELMYPDVALDQFGNQGFWTLIYNQGFEVVVGTRKYFAFSNFTNENQTVINHCSSTLNGWSHDLISNNWACYYGKKSDSKLEGKKVEKLSIDLQRKYKPNDDFVSDINSVQKLWHATNYPQMSGLSLESLLRRAGGVPSAKTPTRPHVSPVSEQIRLATQSLPESFDWRDRNGVNFVSPVRDQAQCGSCYAFASMAMMESRLRILTNNTLQVVLSPQDVVGCSKYSQGCEGGFPYLIAGKYAEDFGAVEESCFPYIGKDSSCTEKDDCLRYYATNYYYIGGYYGACNEPQMRMELVNNGPIAVGFEVLNDFLNYKGGIYNHTGLTDKFNPWVVTNHAVLVVGYGTENGIPYWSVKNSWGEDWGEKGYFRILRGVDLVGIESMALATTPLVP